MAVPSAITDLSTTVASNSPAGSESPSLIDDYLRAQAGFLAQMYSGNAPLLSSVAGTDTITGTVTPTPTAYAAGQVFRFISAGANTTTAVTLNVSSLGAKSVTKLGANALAAGDIPSGAVVQVVYDGTRFQIIGLTSQIAAAINTMTSPLTITVNGTTPITADTSGNISLPLGTANQVQYLNGSKVLSGSANLTFDGTTLTSNALTVTNAVTLSGGTANGVPYLNASKVLTSGSSFTYDGSATWNMASANPLLKLTGDAGSYYTTIQGFAGGYGASKGFHIDTYNGLRLMTSGDIQFYPGGTTLNNGSEIACFTSTGLGIGTSSPAQALHVVSTGNAIKFPIRLQNDGTSGSTLGAGQEFYIYNGTSVAKLGGLIATGSTWTYGTYSANQLSISSVGSGGVRVATASAPITFHTGNADADLSSERMRLDSSGNLLVGYTSSNGAYKLQVNSQIFATSSTIATSDARYKENVTPLSGALTLVSRLNPVQFSWKEHPVHAFDRTAPTIGFLAQEVQTALAGTPYLPSIVKTNTCTISPEVKDDDGNVTQEAVTEEFLGIAEGNMVALLTKAIQEQQALIESLTSRIAALEAK